MVVDLLEQELLPAAPAFGAAASSAYSVLPLAVGYSLLGRNAGVITSATEDDALNVDGALPRGSGFSDVQDFRRFHPMGSNRPLGELRRGASDEMAPGELPFDPGELERIKERYRQAPLRRLNSLSGRTQFRDPQWVVICLKRRIRREVLGAFGVLGRRSLNGPRMRWHSRVIC